MRILKNKKPNLARILDRPYRNKPETSKIEAAIVLQPPKSLNKLRSFMGILNHVSRFIPNLQKYTELLRPDSKN